MITEGITFGPIVDIFIDPMFKGLKINWLIFFMPAVNPITGDKGLFAIVSFKKFFAKSENLFFA